MPSRSSLPPSSPRPSAPGAAESATTTAFAHPGVDWPTLGLAALLWGGFSANVVWALRDPAPLWIHTLVAIWLVNLTFTVWHEGVHGTVFRSRWANDVVGLLGTYPSMLPYFAIRRNHILHHEHTNDPERDPDHWFLEGSIWTLPGRYLRGAARARELVLATNPPAWELWVDRLVLLSIPAWFVLAWWAGVGWLPVFLWLVPKLVAMWIHAWYVNWLPHRGLPSERFRDTRVFPLTWLNPWMLCHNYHGLHHAWQTVPWHRYPRAFREKRAYLEERGMPIRERLLQA